MISRLVVRSLLDRPGRSVLLLAGYALGVGVTVALLSIGSALVEGSRDRELLGGGDLTVLPAGLDLETFRTGGVSSLYFTIEQAPFLYRQVLAGPRLRDRVAAAAPWIEDELLYLALPSGREVAVSAGGQVPSRAAALGVPPRLRSGSWEDLPADRRWTTPGDSALLAGIDAFHRPRGPAARDSTWAEWHYFNVRLPGEEGWLYLTYMVAGALERDGGWGGRVLATRVSGAGRETRTFVRDVPGERVEFSTHRPDLSIGEATVRLDGAGRYRLEAHVPGAGAPTTGAGDASGGEGPALGVELTIRAASRRYVPPLDVSPGDFPSGYVVPILDGRATGRICAGERCVEVREALAYHDHNWGTWAGVTWDWGQAHAAPWSVLYGGVRSGDGGAPAPADGAGVGSRFVFLADELGFAGLYPVDTLVHRRARGPGDRERRPVSVRVRAGRGDDSVRLDVRVDHVRASRRDPSRPRRPEESVFFQMEGRAELGGRLRGRDVRGEGPGFFETWAAPARIPLSRAGVPRPSGGRAGAPQDSEEETCGPAGPVVRSGGGTAATRSSSDPDPKGRHRP